MKTVDAIHLAGSASKLAAILGISRSAISHWDEDMPPLRVFQLQVLRPEWFVDYLNKLV